MTRNFTNLLKILKAKEIEFVIVGGFAGVMYGCTTFTLDIDICLNFTRENLLKLQQALSGLNPVHRMTPNKIKLELNEQNYSEFKNLYLDTDLGILDCLGYLDGVGDFQKVFSKSRQVEVDNLVFNILSIDALIESKRYLHRPKDMQVIAELEIIKNIKIME